MDDRTRTYACLAVAVLLVVVGSLATGVVPATLPYQALAGAVIVAGFALAFACVGALFPE